MHTSNHSTLSLAVVLRSVSSGAFAFAALALTPPVHAQNLYVSSDRTVANGNAINGTYDMVHVGRDSGGSNYDGVHADVTGGIYNGNFIAFNTSLVNVTGGDFKSYLAAGDASLMNFGGTANAEDHLVVGDTAILNVTGGTANAIESQGSFTSTHYLGGALNFGGTAQANTLLTLNYSLTNITGGTLYGSTNSAFSLFASESSKVNISGGKILSGVAAASQSMVNITGGNIFNGVNAVQQSIVNLGGSAQSDFVAAGYNSTVNVSGGTISLFLDAFDTSTVNITGGNTSETVFGDGGIYNISGGQFVNTVLDNEGPFFGLGYSTFNLFGTNLTLSHPTAGIFNDGFGDMESGVFWNLTGMLQNGDVLDTRYFEYDGSLSAPAHIYGATVVPEPGVWSLLMGFGSVSMMWLLCRRKSSNCSHSERWTR